MPLIHSAVSPLAQTHPDGLIKSEEILVLLNAAMKWDVGPQPHIPFHSCIQQRGNFVLASFMARGSLLG